MRGLEGPTETTPDSGVEKSEREKLISGLAKYLHAPDGISIETLGGWWKNADSDTQAFAPPEFKSIIEEIEGK